MAEPAAEGAENIAGAPQLLNECAYRPKPKARRRRHANLTSETEFPEQDSTAADDEAAGTQTKSCASFYTIDRQVERRCNPALVLGETLQVELFLMASGPSALLDEVPGPSDDGGRRLGSMGESVSHRELFETQLKREFEDAYFDAVDELILTTIIDCLLDAPPNDPSLDPSRESSNTMAHADTTLPFTDTSSPFAQMLKTFGPVIDGCVPSEFAKQAAQSVPVNNLVHVRENITHAPEATCSGEKTKCSGTVLISDLPLLEVQAPRLRQGQRVALIDNLTDDNVGLLLDGPREYKDVVLPITPGVSLGMIFDIAENKVVVTDFVPVPSNLEDSPGKECAHVAGCAEESGEIGIGDMVVGIDGHLLEAMNFDEIVAVVQNITRSGSEYVVLTIRLQEFIAQELKRNRHWSHDGDMNDDTASFLAEESQLFFDGAASRLHRGTALSTLEWCNPSNSSNLQPKSGAYSFPGEIGLRLDPNELDRRLKLLMEDTRRYRLLTEEGQRFGWFEDERVSPLLRLHSVKRWRRPGRCVEDAAEESGGDISTRLEAERSWESIDALLQPVPVSGGGDNIKREVGILAAPLNRWTGPLSGTVANYVQKVSTFELGNLEEHLQGWGAKYGLQRTTEEGNHQLISGTPDEALPRLSPSTFSKIIAKTTASDSRRLKRQTNVTGVVFPDLSGAIDELRDQLVFEITSERTQYVREVQRSLDITLGLAKQIGESQWDLLSVEDNIQIMSLLLEETARGVSGGYLGNKCESALDSWPPRVLTSFLSTTICLRWRHLVDANVAEVVDAMLSSWIMCMADGNIWNIVERAFDAESTGDDKQVSSLEPLRGDANSVLHFECVSSLVTLYAQSHIVGWHCLEMISNIEEVKKEGSSNDGSTLKFRLKQSFMFEYETTSHLKLWSEEKALGFLKQVVAFVPVDDVITSAGFRQWTAVTSFLLDSSTSKEQGSRRLSSCRHACELIAHIVRHDGRHMEADGSLRRYFGSAGAAHWLGETSLSGSCASVSKSNGCSKGRKLIRQVLNKAEKNEGYLALLLEVGQIVWAYDSALAASVFARSFPRLLPWHVWRILASSFAPLTFSRCDVGLRVAVWWSGDNDFFCGSIVAFSSSPTEYRTRGTHTIQYDDGDVRNYDLTTKLFKVLANVNDVSAKLSSFDFAQCAVEPPSPVGVSREQSEEDGVAFRHRFIPSQFEVIARSWWESRLHYLGYLARLLGVQSCRFEGNDVLNGRAWPGRHISDFCCPRNNVSIVHEFIELSLLMSSKEAHAQMWPGKKEPTSSPPTRDKLFLLSAALGGDDFTRGVRQHNFPGVNETQESVQFAAGIGLAAMQERLRNSVIRAKSSTFSHVVSLDETREVSDSRAIDQDAWLVRVFMHPDYNYVDKVWGRNKKWGAWIDKLWRQHSSADAPANRYTDPLGDDVDVEMLVAKLTEFSAITAELDESLHGNDANDAGTTTTDHWVNYGYRNAWSAPRIETSTGSLLQEAWASVLPVNPSFLLHENSTAAQFSLMEGVDLAMAFDPQARPWTNSNLLRLGVVCMRYGYWQGVLKVCDTWLCTAIEIGTDYNELFEMTPTKSFELIRHVALSVWISPVIPQSDGGIAFLEHTVVTSLSLVDRLGTTFGADLGLARRMPRESDTLKSLGDRLVASLAVELQVVIQPTTSPRNSQLLISCLLTSLGVLRGLAVASWIPGLRIEDWYDTSTSISSVDRCFFSDRVLLADGHDALAQLHASVLFDAAPHKENGWGYYVDRFVPCSYCGGSLPEVEDDINDTNRRCVALRCGHTFHSKCLQGTGGLCELCADASDFLSIFD